MLSIYESACDVSTDDIVFSGFTSLHERTVILMCISWHSIDSMCSMSNSDTTYMYNQSTAVRLLCAHRKWEKKLILHSALAGLSTGSDILDLWYYSTLSGWYNE